MPVRFEPAMPIGAVRSRISTSGGGGGGGGGGRGTNYSAEAIAVLGNQTERDLAYREEQVQQRHIDDTLLEIERQQTQGQLTPELANSLRIQTRSAQMRHGVDPSEARLREAQARQYELENVQLSRQEDAALQQLTAARARIRERVALQELSPAQGQMQDAYLQQQIAPLAARRTRAGALQQQMDSEMMRQQAEERVIQRRNPATGEVEDWVVDRYGVPQPPRTSRFAEFSDLYNRVSQGMRTRNELTGAQEEADPAAVMERIRQIQAGFQELMGGGQQGPRLPRIVEGGTETFNPDAPLAGRRDRAGVVHTVPVTPEMQQGQATLEHERTSLGAARRMATPEGQRQIDRASAILAQSQRRPLTDAEQQEYAQIRQQTAPLTERAVVYQDTPEGRQPTINPRSRPTLFNPQTGQSLPDPNSPHMLPWLERVSRGFTRGGRPTHQLGADAQALAYLIRTHGPYSRMPETARLGPGRVQRVREAANILMRRLGMIAFNPNENQAEAPAPVRQEVPENLRVPMLDAPALGGL